MNMWRTPGWEPPKSCPLWLAAGSWVKLVIMKRRGKLTTLFLPASLVSVLLWLISPSTMPVKPEEGRGWDSPDISHLLWNTVLLFFWKKGEPHLLGVSSKVLWLPSSFPCHSPEVVVPLFGNYCFGGTKLFLTLLPSTKITLKLSNNYDLTNFPSWVPFQYTINGCQLSNMLLIDFCPTQPQLTLNAAIFTLTLCSLPSSSMQAPRGSLYFFFLFCWCYYHSGSSNLQKF